MSEGRLIVCGTPIGNLGDVSERLRQALCSADVVYAEDTRRTAKLLSHVGCDTRLRSLFTGNEMARTEELVGEVAGGKTVVLVSDAGMPVVSDPGAEAVRRTRAEGYSVSVVPGPSAVTTALVLSGFAGDRFVFEGFLPRKGNDRVRRLSSIASEDRPVILFVSPRRLATDLTDLNATLGGERQVAIARELTKLHEEVWVGSLDAALDTWVGDVKGEITVVIEPGEVAAISVDEAVRAAAALVADGMSQSDAARQVAADTGVSRRSIYQGLLET